jgi:Cu+-exporting ATPase
VQPDGREVQVPIDRVAVGDILIIRPGERVPVDGVIVEGFSAIDESMLTGESIPVDRQVGDSITGGTVNGHGMLKMRATRVGSETALAQIIRMVEEAQGSKAPIQRLADVVSSYFVPAVMVVAAVAFAGWMIAGSGISRALVNATAVLVIACPCALGLATPTAIMVATGRGAELGILIRGGEHLERLSSVRAVVLDKTGTITVGMPSLQEVETFTPYRREEALQLAASAERASEHPLGSAIVEEAELAGIEIPMPDEFRTVPGRGIIASVEGKEVAIGTLKFMDEAGISVDDAGAVAMAVARMQDLGQTAVVQAVDGEVAAVYGIADQVRPGSVEAVRELGNLGIDVYMITGDNLRTAAAIAERVGIPEARIQAEVLPEGKAREVEKLQEAGLVVAMVGDGINDAPALATADVGVAMSTGTDVAMEAADITIVGDLGRFVSAVKLSKRTLTIIKENLFWAFVYNTIGIPLAAFGVLPPVYAGAAMSLSSVSVVSNSLRLRRFTAERPRRVSMKDGKGVESMPYGRKDTSDSKESMVAGPGSTEKSAAAAGMVGDYGEAFLNVHGMSCGHCKAAVEGALMGVEGVESVEVDLEAKSARVVYDRNEARPSDLVRAVEDAGYEVLR